MAGKKGKKAAGPLELVLRDGTVYPVTGEAGKFWLCGSTQFRKGSGRIAAVREAPKAEKPDEKEE